MKTVYKILAYIIAAEVVVQAMLMVYAVAGEFKWINNGGVLDKAVVESRGTPFPEVIGIPLHGMNGSFVIPALGLLLLISSFFAKIPGGVKWAGLVFLLVIIQPNLGFAGHDIPALGALHGLNAMLLFAAALHTARRQRRMVASQTAEAHERLETPA